MGHCSVLMLAPWLFPLTVEVGFGGGAGEVAKLFGEVAVAAESAVEGDRRDRLIRLFQQLFGPLHPLLN